MIVFYYTTNEKRMRMCVDFQDIHSILETPANNSKTLIEIKYKSEKPSVEIFMTHEQTKDFFNIITLNSECNVVERSKYEC